MLELLSVEEMARADAATIAAGAPGIKLMEAAGLAVADEVSARFPLSARVAVLCGPGNNGGDGFVAARILKERGYRIRTALLGDVDALRGDAAEAARRLRQDPEPMSTAALEGAGVIVDALFGAGLSRPLEGLGAEIIAAVAKSGIPLIAVDLPSGLSGDTGAVLGIAPQADVTVTFFRPKPGHLMFPGRRYCGRLRLVDIGIPDTVLADIAPKTWINEPPLWQPRYPLPRIDGHKYDRGHAVVVSGPASRTGAARLAAAAALRIGAGLVTMASPKDAMEVNACHLTAVMLARIDGSDGLSELLTDGRKNAVAVGPGAGVGEGTRALVRAAIGGTRKVVLDADALTSFGGERGVLRDIITRAAAAEVVLTPHEGEFARLFPDLADGSKLDRARRAAGRVRAVVVLKGADTVIADPAGRAAIARNAPPWLATAGSGDVLTGIICGLLAQGMPAFEAAAAAVWIHGEAARNLGPGLVAEDLNAGLRPVIARLLEQSESS